MNLEYVESEMTMGHAVAKSYIELDVTRMMSYQYIVKS